MNDDDFKLLLESVTEAGAIIRGEQEASRTRSYTLPDVRKIRDQAKLTSAEFARFMGVSEGQINAWELNRTRPRGSSRRLLEVVQENPKLLTSFATTIKAARPRAGARAKTLAKS
jgi:putative transcriptional regulator